MGNVDSNPGDFVEIGDLTALTDYLFLTVALPDCMEEANVDGDPSGLMDRGDLTGLVDYLFITNRLPAGCL